MSPLFDDRTWRDISQATQRFADMRAMQEKLQRQIDLFNSPAVQRQIDFLNSPAVQRQIDFLNSPVAQRQIDLMNTVGPALQQYANLAHIAHNTRASDLIQRYIEQLQTELAREPEQHEVLEYPEAELALPETREHIVIYSPSLLLLEKLRTQHISLHDLTWRQFEEVVAELLNQDGFTVDLGRGTKDDGKDIVAVKEVRGIGLVMSVWQAKKHNVGKKVGVGVIRELADTRNEIEASKGVIVTTTSLTRGALKRIEQDRYLLHKVDGDDLLTWIQQTRQPEGGNC